MKKHHCPYIRYVSVPFCLRLCLASSCLFQLLATLKSCFVFFACFLSSAFVEGTGWEKSQLDFAGVSKEIAAVLEK